jgi:hypothetical protein
MREAAAAHPALGPLRFESRDQISSSAYPKRPASSVLAEGYGYGFPT